VDESCLTDDGSTCFMTFILIFSIMNDYYTMCAFQMLVSESVVVHHRLSENGAGSLQVLYNARL
jgi:hypothetical protein